MSLARSSDLIAGRDTKVNLNVMQLKTVEFINKYFYIQYDKTTLSLQQPVKEEHNT